MALLIVSDAVKRLLQLAEGNGEEHIMNMASDMIERGMLNQLYAIISGDEKYVGRGKFDDEDEEEVPDSLKEWMKRLKRVLYEMEELVDEVGIFERERVEQIPAGSCSHFKLLIRPLCCILASNNIPSDLLIVQERQRLAQQFESLVGNLIEIHTSVPEEVGILNEKYMMNPYKYATQPGFMQCLAYCSLLPKDYEINNKYLVSIWMAQGFLVQEEGGNFYAEEAVGHR